MSRRDDTSSPEKEGDGDEPTFKAMLRQPPFVEDFPDTSDLREELPQERDLGLDL
jgi:hypothetical protein